MILIVLWSIPSWVAPMNAIEKSANKSGTTDFMVGLSWSLTADIPEHERKGNHCQNAFSSARCAQFRYTISLAVASCQLRDSTKSHSHSLTLRNSLVGEPLNDINSSDSMCNDAEIEGAIRVVLNLLYGRMSSTTTSHLGLFPQIPSWSAHCLSEIQKYQCQNCHKWRSANN